MTSPIKKLFFKDAVIRTFAITRLHDNEIVEKVFLRQGRQRLDITLHHSMICLDPFCISVWLSAEDTSKIDPQQIEIEFVKDNKRNAWIKASLIEKVPADHGVLLLFKIEKVKNYQLSPLHRLVFFGWLLRSKKNTFYSRRVISALYSYPRRIIIVSYKDDDYYNIFPMDIQGYISEDKLYVLGLRTTNITLDKILKAKKVVICNTDSVDIDTVYSLGKHSSTKPTPVQELPFKVSVSEQFGFFVPDFSGSYKEVEIIYNRNMGYHTLMVGKVVNEKEIKPNHSSLFHVGFLQFQQGNYTSIEGLF